MSNAVSVRVSTDPICHKSYLKLFLKVDKKRMFFTTSVQLSHDLDGKKGVKLQPYLQPLEYEVYERLRTKIVGIVLDLAREGEQVTREKILSRTDSGKNTMVEDLKKFVQMKLDSGEIKPQTAEKVYKRLVNALEEFNPGTYTKAEHQRFLHFLRSTKKLSDTTIGIYFSRLRCFLNNYYNSFDSSFVKRIETSKAIHYLYAEEVALFHNLPRTGSRDLFLCMCYCGFRHSDYDKFNTDKIEKGLLTYIQKKTSLKAIAPINDFVLDVLEYYGGRLPAITNQAMNRAVKNMATELGLDRLVDHWEWRGGKKIESRVALMDVISTSSGRKTFVTLGIEKGIPIPILMKLSGHRKMDVVMKHYLGEMDMGVKDACDTLSKLYNP